MVLSFVEIAAPAAFYYYAALCLSIEVSCRYICEINGKGTFGRKIIEYIMTNLLDRPSLSEICSHFGYSRNYFAQKFKDIFGLPYTSFLSGLLMRDAAKMLVQSQKPIHEIASRYGFASSYQFSRAFKRDREITEILPER